MNKDLLIKEELIFLDYEASDKEELLQSLSNILREKGYVKDTFASKIIEREKVFPTGLNTGEVQVAIPHTDAIHVENAAIVFVKLKNSVTFKEMGSGVNDVNANLIFMLAVKNPKEQVNVLSKLMSILSNGEILKKLYESKTKEEVYKILSDILK